MRRHAAQIDHDGRRRIGPKLSEYLGPAENVVIDFITEDAQPPRPLRRLRLVPMDMPDPELSTRLACLHHELFGFSLP
jgi:hypothetical protein